MPIKRLELALLINYIVGTATGISYRNEAAESTNKDRHRYDKLSALIMLNDPISRRVMALEIKSHMHRITNPRFLARG